MVEFTRRSSRTTAWRTGQNQGEGQCNLTPSADSTTGACLSAIKAGAALAMRQGRGMVIWYGMPSATQAH